jgi:hypothetical protein
VKVALEYGLSDLPLIKIAARKARHFLVFVPRCVYLFTRNGMKMDEVHTHTPLHTHTRKARHFLVFVPRCVYLPLFRAFSLQYESLYVVPVRRKTLSARGSEVDIGPGAGAEMLRYASVSKET